MKLYSYVVAHDYGFAPNPFYGVCTLATCKPGIRKGAAINDYVVGTGSSSARRRGYLVYFMRIEKIVTFDEYWADPSFRCKRPSLSGSKMRAFGDNIYHRDAASGVWVQAKSFHSQPDGRPHRQNIEHDTKSERVLIGTDFAYWGGAGPKIPACFRNYNGDDICKNGQGYRVNFVPGFVEDFIAWIRGFNQYGYIGRPLDWDRRATVMQGQTALLAPV